MAATSWRNNRFTRLDAVLVALLFAWGLARLLPGLAHDSIWAFDESFHQAVSRHTFDHPMMPSLYDDPVHDSTDSYWGARVWLVKPPGTFWVAAFFMNFVGAVPLAFRLGGLCAQLIAAFTIFLLGRMAAGRAAAFIAALGMLALPAAWTFTQGRFIGDMLDLELCGALCLAMLALFKSIEKRSLAWAALAGVATGAGVLIKFVLAATPIGVAGVLWGLSLVGFTTGPRLRDLVMMIVATVAIATPWNVYASKTWPEHYRIAVSDMRVHTEGKEAAARAPQWIRPADAVFNEIISGLSNPVPGVVMILAGVWLLVCAFRSRDTVLIGLAAWLWATWLGHSFVPIKIYSHLWNAVVPQAVALALLLTGSVRRWWLALATLAGLASPWVIQKWPQIQKLREYAPASSQSRVSELVVGVVLMLGAIVLAVVLHFIFRRRARWLVLVPGVTAALWLANVMVRDGVEKQRVLFDEAQAHFNTAFSKTVGLALQKNAPAKSIVLLDVGDPYGQIEPHNLLFWSDRLVFRGRDPKDYPANGFAPYLVTSVAENFEPFPVPASAWLRAYDLTKPTATPAPVPEGLTRLDTKLGQTEVVGYAAEPAQAGSARYAFIVKPNGEQRSLRVRFTTDKGPTDVVVAPGAALKPAHELARAAWYVMPVIGPADVTRVEVLQ